MDRLQPTKRRRFLAQTLGMFALVAVAGTLVAPQTLLAGHAAKASRNPKKLWEKAPPKHKVQHDLGILPINTFIKKVIHHDGDGKHGGFHGGGKGRDGAGNCEGC
jgi:hypothetical protein